MRGEYPAFTLVLVNKDNKKDKTIAGAAWHNNYGGLSLKLNPGIVIKWNDEFFLNLNPRMTKEEYRKYRQDQEEESPSVGEDDFDFIDNMSEEEEEYEPDFGQETRSD